MSTSTPQTRKVFNKLHEALSLHLDYNFPRFQLWNWVAEDYSPREMTVQDAEAWCRENKFYELADEMSKYDPDLETPDEIFDRIIDGLRK